MGSKPKTPAPLNVSGVTSQANAQNLNNAQQQAAFNRINQSGPFGSVSYTQSGTDANGNPVFNQSTTLDPTQLGYLNTLQSTAADAYKGGIAGLSQFAQNAGGTNLQRVAEDPYGLMQAGATRLLQPQTPTDSTAAFDKAYGFATDRMNRNLADQEAQLKTQLVNQGFQPGTEGYDRALRQQRETAAGMRNEAAANLQNQFFNQGITNRQLGTQEASNLYGFGSGTAGQLFGQDQAIDAAGRAGDSLGLSAYGQLAGQGSMVNPILTPGVSGYNGVNVANVDVAGLANQSKVNEYQNYNSNMQQYNGMLGGLAGLGGTILSAPFTGGSSVAGALMGGLGGLYKR